MDTDTFHAFQRSKIDLALTIGFNSIGEPFKRRPGGYDLVPLILVHLDERR